MSSQNVAPVTNNTPSDYITFNDGAAHTGDVTNNSSLSAPGTYPADSPGGSATGISVLELGTVLNGNIINNGTIDASNAGVNIGEGRTTRTTQFNAGAVLNGSITNSGTITSNVGIDVVGNSSPLLSTVTGSIINTAGGQIIYTDVGINIGFATVGGSITNAATISGTGTAGINFTFGSLGSTGTPGSGNIVNATGAKIASSYIGIIVNGNTQTAGVNTTIAGSIINNGNVTVPNLFTHAGLEVAAATVLGGLTNTGTINGGVGIMAFGGTDHGGPARIASIAGNIVNQNQINALSTTGTAVGIWLLGSNGGGPAIVGGRIMNSGTISVTSMLAGAPSGTNDGILLAGTRLVGGITNSNTISVSGEAANVGIAIANNTSANFAPANSSIGGSIVNLGSITAGTGVLVNGGSTVAGSISNTTGGTITGTQTGIVVSGSSVVIDGITNGGDLSGGVVAIDVSGEGAATTITQAGGVITGDILLSSLGDTVDVTGGAINGDIDGTGASGTVDFTLGTGTFTYSNMITGVQAVNFNSGTVVLDGAIDPATLTVAASATLLIGNSSASLDPGITDNGTFGFDQSGAFSYGAIAGSGVVEQIGSGTTTLAGADSVLGGTDISVGTLELGSGGSVAGNVTFAGAAVTLRFDTGTNQLGGDIAGAVAGDAIGLHFQSFATGDHAVWSQNGSTGTLTIETASNVTLATLMLAGQYATADFKVSADTQNNVLVDLVAGPPTNLPHVSPSNVDEWILADGEWTASAQPGSIPSGYQVAGTGDFTGNGTSDILWQNPSTGDTQEWLINNGAWAGTVDLGTHPGNFQIAGVGHFFGNGIDDVLWTSTNNNGTVATDIWELSSSGQWQASVSPGSHPAGYNVVGVGDFTGNGTSDILWQNSTTGDVDEWQLSNGQWSASVDLGSHPGTGWSIVGVGDFFGSGIDDIFWANSSGGEVQTDIWELGSNGQWAASVTPGLGLHPAGYQVAAIGNFTGNGTDGVLWYDPTNGNVDEWVLDNHGQWATSVDLGTHPGNFQIAGTGSFVNGNSTSDILWHAPS